MRISDWSSDVCSSDLEPRLCHRRCPCHEARSCHEPAFGEFVRCLIDLIDGDLSRQPLDQFAQSVVERRFGLEAEYLLGERRIGETMTDIPDARSEEHTSELQSLMRISYAVFCLKKKKTT